jgi:manganese/iron transport system ATP-binding protein
MTAYADLAIEMEEVTAGYGGPPALREVTLSVPAGRRVGIIGPNGSGKSTLLRVLLGLLPPARGRVTVLGGPPTAAHRRRHPVGYVPQGRAAVDFPITVGQLVMTGRLGQIGLLRRPGRADHAAVAAALAEVGLVEQRDRRLGDLSGGQRQRAYLARALAQAPRLLLLDEPLTGLDLPSQAAIHRALAARHAEGVTVVVTTHDLLAVEDLALDRLICLNQTVVADGPPAAILTESVLTATYGAVVVAVRRLLAARL